MLSLRPACFLALGTTSTRVYTIQEEKGRPEEQDLQHQFRTETEIYFSTHQKADAASITSLLEVLASRLVDCPAISSLLGAIEPRPWAGQLEPGQDKAMPRATAAVQVGRAGTIGSHTPGLVEPPQGVREPRGGTDRSASRARARARDVRAGLGREVSGAAAVARRSTGAGLGARARINAFAPTSAYYSPARITRTRRAAGRHGETGFGVFFTGLIGLAILAGLDKPLEAWSRPRQLG
jgi:hypothetical protein